MLVSSCFEHIFSWLIEYKNALGISDSNAKSIENTIKMMGANLSNLLTLGALADYASMSKYHFERIFRQKTGFPPVEYLNRLKIQRACELMDTTVMSIEEISNLLGFSNQFYFSKVFKKIMGYPPMVYKCNLRMDKC